MTNELPRLFKLEEIAEALQVERDFVQLAAREGRLKRVPGMGRRWRFRAEDVEAYVTWLMEHGNDREEAPAPAPKAVLTHGRGRQRVVVS